jgi:hypothetical protein
MARTISERSRLWLAGYLEGEGSFGYHSFSPRVSVQTTDLDVIIRVAALMRTPVKGPLLRGKNRNPIWYTQAYGDDARNVMTLVKPFMGTRRRCQINAVLEIKRVRGKRG